MIFGRKYAPQNINSLHYQLLFSFVDSNEESDSEQQRRRTPRKSAMNMDMSFSGSSDEDDVEIPTVEGSDASSVSDVVPDQTINVGMDFSRCVIP